MFNPTMTPLGGLLNQSEKFTGTEAPTGTSCAVATPITATDGTTAQPVQVTLTRTTTGLLLPPATRRTPPLSPLPVGLSIVALTLLFFLPKTSRPRGRLGLATAAVLLLVLAVGCAGGGSKPPITGNLTIKHPLAQQAA